MERIEKGEHTVSVAATDMIGILCMIDEHVNISVETHQRDR